jgi:hypothetical protein
MMDAETPDLRQRIMELMLSSTTLDAAADAILAALPDPRLAPGGNNPPEEIETEQQRLLGINPEALLVLEPDELPTLFDLHYPALVERAGEVLGRCQEWQGEHRTKAGGWIDVKDDAENGKLADLVRQVDDFADEVEEARKKVKKRVFEAGQKIDGWFNGGLKDPVGLIRGVTQRVNNRAVPPGPGTMQWAQTKYLTDKAERERQERALAAAAAQLDADRKIAEARQAAQEEEQRKAALEAEGVAPEEAQEIAEAESNQAAAVADAAQESSALVGSYAAQPERAMVRQTTATGTTVGLAGRWDFEVTDIRELCLAVGAPLLTSETFVNRVSATSMAGVSGCRAVLQAVVDILTHESGPLPATFMATEDKSIRAAITARTAPLRSAPGLRIFQNVSARRRGG